MNHELNAQVAEEVMGWIVQRMPFPPIYVVEVPPDGEDWTEAWLPIPDFSGSLDAAWQMEEEIERRGIAMVTAYEKELSWIVGDTRQGEPFICSYDPWLFIHATPEQRCRAALEAVREK